MAKTLEPKLGFTVWIEPRTGIAPAAQAAFMRRMEDYLDARDLQFDGAPLRAVIWSPERSLSATDQVELLDWLIDDAAVCTASVSPLTRHSTGPASCATATSWSVPPTRQSWPYRCCTARAGSVPSCTCRSWADSFGRRPCDHQPVETRHAGAIQ